MSINPFTNTLHSYAGFLSPLSNSNSVLNSPNHRKDELNNKKSLAQSTGRTISSTDHTYRSRRIHQAIHSNKFKTTQAKSLVKNCADLSSSGIFSFHSSNPQLQLIMPSLVIQFKDEKNHSKAAKQPYHDRSIAKGSLTARNDKNSSSSPPARHHSEQQQQQHESFLSSYHQSKRDKSLLRGSNWYEEKFSYPLVYDKDVNYGRNIN
jgi:hypothetical protein